jgi:predicted phage-related endonuclease
MNANIEKLLAMLSMESVKVRESKNLKEIETFYLEIQRFIKTEYQKLEEARNQLYIEALNGQEQAQINNWMISYKSMERFALDTKKLVDYFVNGNMTEEEMKNLLYSHTITKPKLSFKAVK